MKVYGKKTGKLFQFYLQEEENERLLAFIKKIGRTRRDVILAMLSGVENYNILRDGEFWMNDAQYAHTRGRYKDKNPGVCEICNKKGRPSTDIIGHHHDGYEGENAHRVKYICWSCHGLVHSLICKGIKEWEEVVTKIKQTKQNVSTKSKEQ